MADYQLEQVGASTYYIPSAVNIGIFILHGTAFIIDSGGDKDSGRKIRKLLDAAGWKLGMILNTHSNADHIGGNAYLQGQYGCRIGASPREKPFIEFPEFETMFLWGGFPHSKIENKFLKAKPSAVTDVLLPGTTEQETGIEIVDLPGHFIQMIGFRTPDNILFAADALFPEEIISKYHIFYICDVAAFLETINFLQQEDADLVIPSHCRKQHDISHLAEINRAKVHEILGNILTLCDTPKSPDELISGLCRIYSLDMNASQYVLVGSTVRSYIAFLQKSGKLAPVIEDKLFKWQCQ